MLASAVAMAAVGADATMALEGSSTPIDGGLVDMAVDARYVNAHANDVSGDDAPNAVAEVALIWASRREFGG